MRVEVELLPARERRTAELGDGATGEALFRRLGLAVDAHILVRSETPIPVDSPLTDGERLLVIAVASGG